MIPSSANNSAHQTYSPQSSSTHLQISFSLFSFFLGKLVLFFKWLIVIHLPSFKLLNARSDPLHPVLVETLCKLNADSIAAAISSALV